MLVVNGAQTQIYTKDGRGCLWLAANAGRLDVVKWLVREIKVPVNYATEKGSTPLDRALL